LLALADRGNPLGKMSLSLKVKLLYYNVLLDELHRPRGTAPLSSKFCSELNIFQIRVLDALLREQSLTRAADLLDTTQPALSKTLSRLRQHFDDPLFVRVAHRMKPTTKAQSLASSVNSIIRELSVLQNEQLPFCPEVSSRDFRFFGTDAAAVILFPPVLKKMRECAPNIQLAGVTVDAKHLHGALESGEVDLAGGSYRFLIQGIKQQLLFKTNYLSLVRKRHPRLAELTSIAAFTDEQHVLVTPLVSGHYTEAVEHALEAAIPRRNITAHVAGFSTAGLLAKHTDAIATVPKPLAMLLARDLDLDLFQTPLKLPQIEIYQYWHERYDRDPGHVWLRTLFYEQCSPIGDH
jgi:DNA-binding transcriptional LysR family regulator